jgi:glycosyltransferase involved in cell wall biosynthesis
MITFILIGLNEGKTISKSIQSCEKAIEFLNIEGSEIIYIDSNSTDSTWTELESFPNVKQYKINGCSNAAIARNAGVNYSTNDILCFLDADMEINNEFIRTVFKDGRLTYPFVSGKLENILYDQKGKVIGQSALFENLKKDKKYSTTGGYFLIEKPLWLKVGGMDNNLRRCQDMDLGLRLSRNGMQLLRKPKSYALHHTIDYHHKSRKWKMLLDGSFLFSSITLTKKHFNNPFYWPIFLKNNKALIILLVSLLMCLISLNFIFLYIVFVFILCLKTTKERNFQNLLSAIIFQIALNTSTILFFPFFHPKSGKHEVVKVN